jgi:hypothetical protein
MPSLGVWVGETLLCFQRGNVVVEEELFFVGLVPFELWHLATCPSSTRCHLMRQLTGTAAKPSDIASATS